MSLWQLVPAGQAIRHAKRQRASLRTVGGSQHRDILVMPVETVSERGFCRSPLRAAALNVACRWLATGDCRELDGTGGGRWCGAPGAGTRIPPRRGFVCIVARSWVLRVLGVAWRCAGAAGCRVWRPGYPPIAGRSRTNMFDLPEGAAATVGSAQRADISAFWRSLFIRMIVPTAWLGKWHGHFRRRARAGMACSRSGAHTEVARADY